ncbi:hypothetical protein [Thermogemmatispora carboxidivorans]|uniref:hypothetical protein n=1 Tax=Thermogemmatispora carboxidivorans TaxID=1382306 RepID=UPI00069BCCC7|nr:hypothetical protein [Thermogemmatispora carboxidivorans]
MTRFFTFIGVTTRQSSIMRIFPRWRDLLGLGQDVEMVGWDLPINASPEQYRRAVAELKADPNNLGALVTTHKINLYQAACDLFDEVDEYARLLTEISCLAKRDGKLLGWAKDPITAGQALDDILGVGYFARTQGHVLIFGAGGAGVAIALHLLTRPDRADRPVQLIILERRATNLARLRALQQHVAPTASVTYVQNGNPRVGDAHLSALPPGSVIINATGMGKDLPGSPVTDAAQFPERSVVWELNYRGSLDFLHQAQAQSDGRLVRVVDGWRYFIYGWSAVIEEVFNRPITVDELALLEREAAFARPSPSLR